MKMYGLLRIIPKNHLSYVVGWLVNRPLPRPLSTWSVRIFAWLFGIDTQAALKPLNQYSCIGAFFVRDLKSDCRPIASGFVSPVDGTLREHGPVENGCLPQIKGKKYSIKDLLLNADLTTKYNGGYFFNFYLSPQDYHHVHSPVSGSIVAGAHIPGKLWPVNNWSVAYIDNLFPVNERIVACIQSDFGLITLVMIGATCVGKMSVTYDGYLSNQDLALIRERPAKIDYKHYTNKLEVKAGDRIGTFNMGSSVVLLCEQLPPALDRNGLLANTPVKLNYGMELCKLSPQKSS